jgi:hypothetical protein
MLYTTKDRDYMTPRRSQNALLKEANDVSSCARNSEFANKRLFIETERAARLLQTRSTSLTSPPATNYLFIQSQTQQSAIIKHAGQEYAKQSCFPRSSYIDCLTESSNVLGSRGKGLLIYGLLVDHFTHGTKNLRNAFLDDSR